MEKDKYTRRYFLKSIGIGAANVAILSSTNLSLGEEKKRKAERPNIIYIMADDLGWTELGCYGNTFNETPNIDRLAKQGMKFTDAYAPAPVCSPTRAGFLTGKHPARVGIIDYLRPGSNSGLSTKHLTFVERLRKAGYSTGMIGKWHLTGYAYHGSKNEVRATDHGFDEELVTEIKSVGNGANWYPYVFRSQNVPWVNVEKKRLPGNEYLVDRMNLEAVDFIDRHKKSPFFLYLSHYATHTILNGKPHLVHKYLKKHPPGKSSQSQCYICRDIGCDGDPGHHWAQDHNPHLAAMLESIDEGVGMIMDKLEKLDLADDTLIVFTSDNGGETNVTSNAPLRKGKSCLYEGGIRVPLVASWKGKVPFNTICKRPVSILDFYPTFLQAADLKADSKQNLDGVSILPVLENPTAGLERDELIWHYPLEKPHFLGGRSSGAIRKGDWKLIEFFDTGEKELYNLREDIGEKNDLSRVNPERTNELLNRLKRWRKATGVRVPKGCANYKPEQIQ